MPLNAWLCLFGCNLLAGSSYVATAYVLRGFSPAAAVFWRLLLASAVLFPLTWKAWSTADISRKDWLRIGFGALLGMALPLTLGAMGLKRSTATNAALLIGVQPASIVVMSALFFGEELSAMKLGALLLGVAGSCLIVLQGFPWRAGLNPHSRGDMLLFLQACLWSIYSITGKSVLRRIPSALFTGLTTFIAVVPMIFLAGRAAWPEPGPPAAALWGLAYQAIGVSLGATLLWNKGLQLVPASMMANFIFLQPLIGALLGVVLQHDPITSWSVAGGALIIVGVLVASRHSPTVPPAAITPLK